MPKPKKKPRRPLPGVDAGPQELRALLDRILAEIVETAAGPRTKKELIARKFVQMAYEGSLPAVQQLWDRTDGRPTERVQLQQELPPVQIVYEVVPARREPVPGPPSAGGGELGT